MDVRPIDANALNLNDLPSYYGTSVREEDVQEWIESAPTLDYAPVRHGEWMPWYKEDKNHKTGFSRGLRQLGWWCSACHGRSGMRTNFCPNCGALMSGGSANGL